MAKASDKRSSELEHIATGADGDVYMLVQVAKEFGRLETKARARLGRIMELFCTGDWQHIPKTQFNPNEGRYAVGSTGKRVLIGAFKGWQVRLYGTVLEYAGKRSFIASAIDPAKKDDRADQKLLKRAAQRLEPFV
jgi:hypothetical protein